VNRASRARHRATLSGRDDPGVQRPLRELVLGHGGVCRPRDFDQRLGTWTPKNGARLVVFASEPRRGSPGLAIGGARDERRGPPGQAAEGLGGSRPEGRSASRPKGSVRDQQNVQTRFQPAVLESIVEEITAAGTARRPRARPARGPDRRRRGLPESSARSARARLPPPPDRAGPGGRPRRSGSPSRGTRTRGSDQGARCPAGEKSLAM